MDYAFSYTVSSSGLHTEDDYSYLTEEVTCDEQGGYKDAPQNSDEDLLKALAHQPVSVAVEASGKGFQFYSGGVSDGPCGSELDHGVAAVGYGSSKGQGYIMVKNSWETKWGEQGYINKMASYPTKDQ